MLHDFSCFLAFDMTRVNFTALSALILLGFVILGSSAGDTCEIARTGEAGECIALLNCQGLVDEIKKNITHSPVVCNKEQRKVCCPTRLLPATTTATPATTKETTEDRPDSANEIDADENDSDSFIASQVIKRCTEFKKQMYKNETVESFVLGEPATYKKISFCNHNNKDIGIVSALEFPHLAIIKIEDIGSTNRNYASEEKCVGSLISERHILTSFFCIKSINNKKVTVYLGVYKYDLSGRHVQSYEVDSLDITSGVSILKLSKKVQFDEAIYPACLYPMNFVYGNVTFVSWTGDWRDCDPIPKKWYIAKKNLVLNRWSWELNQTAMLNYWQSLSKGSPIQINHPRDSCQYSLIGVYDYLQNSKYIFTKLHKKLFSIENTVWPRKLMQMNFKTFDVMKKIS